jgi:hypothetical protein
MKRYKVTIMPRTFPRLTMSIVLLAGAGAALAQTPATGQPPIERIEPGSDVPATRIEPKRGTQIREKRNNSGQVTEVDVQSGGSHYVMKSGQPVGNAQPGDAQSSGIRAPQWQVMEFDLNGKRKAAAAEAAAAGTPAAAATPAAKPAAAVPASARNVPAQTAPMLKPADIPPPPPMPATR